MHHDDEPPALDRIGERAPDDREHEHRHERTETEQADRERRVRQLVDLERHDGRHDLVAEVGDGLPDEEQPEVARLVERGEVHEVLARASDDAPLGVGLGSRGGRLVLIVHRRATLPDGWRFAERASQRVPVCGNVVPGYGTRRGADGPGRNRTRRESRRSARILPSVWHAGQGLLASTVASGQRRPFDGYDRGMLGESPRMSKRWAKALGSASRSGEFRTASTHPWEPPTYVENPSISVATIHARSSGHQ